MLSFISLLRVSASARRISVWHGPSIIIAYSPCINHGLKARAVWVSSRLRSSSLTTRRWLRSATNLNTIHLIPRKTFGSPGCPRNDLVHGPRPNRIMSDSGYEIALIWVRNITLTDECAASSFLYLHFYLRFVKRYKIVHSSIPD